MVQLAGRRAVAVAVALEVLGLVMAFLLPQVQVIRLLLVEVAVAVQMGQILYLAQLHLLAAVLAAKVSYLHL